MVSALDCGGVIPVLPKGPVAPFPTVEFLTRAARQKLHRTGDCLPIFTSENKQVDVVGRHNVIEDGQTVPLTDFEQPGQPSVSITAKFHKEVTLMATMRKVPDMVGQVVTVCSRHAFTLARQFQTQKRPSKHSTKHRHFQQPAPMQ